MKEQTIQKKIIKHIESKGGYVVKVVNATKAGVPDLLACVDGQFIGIEVKTPKTKNNLSELQKYNLNKIERCGGIGIVAWSVKQIEDILL